MSTTGTSSGTGMSREDFMAFIIDHREKPRNNHKIEDADATYTGGNPGCGDIVTMYLKVGDDDTIQDLAFIGEGCTISQAGASFITSRLKGKPLAAVEEMDYDLIINTFGKEVMATRPRCATLGLSTAKTAIRVYRDTQRRADIDAPTTTTTTTTTAPAVEPSSPAG